MSTNPAAYALGLMTAFERAVRQHVADNEYGQCSKMQQIRYERAKERLARKIGQLAADAQKWQDAHDYKDRSPL